MSAKRTMTFPILMLLLLATALLLPGCITSNEELIRQAVTEKYDAYKQADDAALSQEVTSLENSILPEFGIDETEFGTAIVDGFDYHIDSISVDGDHATVTVTFAGKSYADLLTRISEIRDSLANDPEFAALPEEERFSTTGQAVLDALNGLEVKNETVDLSYELKDNKWTESDHQAGLQEIDNILFARTV